MSRPMPRLMMISTHGYVGANPVYGKPDTGGQVSFVLELSKTLARMGYAVDILTRRFERQPAMEPVADNVRVLRFDCGGNDFIPKEVLCDHIPQWVDNATAYIRSRGLEYTFINSHYWDAGLAGQSLSERFGIPHLHTPHSLGVWKRDNMDGDPAEKERLYNFRQRIREEIALYRACDMVIATTPQQRDILKGREYRLKNDKIAVIPPGYDDTRFFPVSGSTRTALKKELKVEEKTVFAVGRIARNKGYDLLIRAMAPVFKRVEDARLMLALGSTKPNSDEQVMLDELKQVATELDVLHRIDFLSYIADEDMANYYRSADVFALSSRYEPFGMTAIEAMACGTPTIVTTEGGLWEQAKWGVDALYANPFDPEAFGHAICSILSYPRVAEQLSKHGAEMARSRYTWTCVAQQTLGLLDDIHREMPLARAYPERVAMDGQVGFDMPALVEDEKLWQPEPSL